MLKVAFEGIVNKPKIESIILTKGEDNQSNLLIIYRVFIRIFESRIKKEHFESAKNILKISH
jgi:hypothetical protein